MPRESHRSRRERATLLPFPSARRLPCASTATLLAHRIPPREQLRSSCCDQLIQSKLHFIQKHCTDHFARLVFVVGKREEFSLKMAARDGVTLTPAHEQQVRAKRAVLLIADVGDDLDAV